MIFDMRLGKQTYCVMKSRDGYRPC